MNLKFACSRNRSSRSPDTPVVFVVNGDASVRDALDSLIRTAGWRPQTAGSADEILALPHTTTPSCLLVELGVPGSSGIDLQRLVVDRTETPVICMSGHADIHAAVQAMKRGAFEFLTKPFDPHVLLDAIRDALERSRAMLRCQAQTQALQARYESLSRREREVMTLVVSGRLNKQVGGALGISEITVKAHRGRLMRKMQADSIAELVRMAASLGCDSPADAGDLQERAVAGW